MPNLNYKHLAWSLVMYFFLLSILQNKLILWFPSLHFSQVCLIVRAVLFKISFCHVRLIGLIHYVKNYTGYVINEVMYFEH